MDSAYPNEVKGRMISSEQNGTGILHYASDGKDEIASNGHSHHDLSLAMSILIAGDSSINLPGSQSSHTGILVCSPIL